MKNDDVIRVVQMRGTKVLKVSSTFSPDEPPIEIAFLTIATTELSISR